MDQEFVDFDTITSNIKQILLQNGWDQPLLVDSLEKRYKDTHQRDLSTDCWLFRTSVDDFLVRSEIFRLFLKFNKTHVYLAPEKLEQPLPTPTVASNSRSKRFKRKKKRQKNDCTVIKFKAMPWGSFEPIQEPSDTSMESHELQPRAAAFEMYSDDETDDCELVEVPPVETQEEAAPNISTTNDNQVQATNPPFNVNYPVPLANPTNVQTTFISSQQIDGPTMFDFQEEENVPEPTVYGLQDLSLYAMRQDECNSFDYNDIPNFRQCINFRAPNRGRY